MRKQCFAALKSPAITVVSVLVARASAALLAVARAAAEGVVDAVLRPGAAAVQLAQSSAVVAGGVTVFIMTALIAVETPVAADFGMATAMGVQRHRYPLVHAHSPNQQRHK